MPNDDVSKMKRKINARATALRSVGKTDEQIADAILAFSDLPSSLRDKIKNAKSLKRSGDMVNEIISVTTMNDSVVGDIEPTKGAIGKLGTIFGSEKIGRRIGYGIASMLPSQKRNLEGISDEDKEKLRTGGVSNREALASAGQTALGLVGGAAGGAALKTLGATGKFASPINTGARALTTAQQTGKVIASPVTSLTSIGTRLGTNAPIRTGVTLGAAEGALSGAQADEFSLEDTLKSTATGAALGGALGSLPLVKRLATGEKLPEKEVKKLLDKITPDYADLSISQKKQYLEKGNVTPRTLTQSQKLQLSDREIATATRHADIIDEDPVRTAMNINSRIGKIDGEVEQFLLQNNGIFNKGELTNAVKKSMVDVVDVTADQAVTEKAKEKIISSFVDSLDKNDVHSLWKARKAFDQRIEQAFSGSPSMQKEVKKALRNAVQDFLASKTPDKTYKTYMNDMSGLYNIYDLAEISATKQAATSKIGEFLPSKKDLTKSIAQGAAFAGTTGLMYGGYRALGGSNEE